MILQIESRTLNMLSKQTIYLHWYCFCLFIYLFLVHVSMHLVQWHACIVAHTHAQRPVSCSVFLWHIPLWQDLTEPGAKLAALLLPLCCWGYRLMCDLSGFLHGTGIETQILIFSRQVLLPIEPSPWLFSFYFDTRFGLKLEIFLP